MPQLPFAGFTADTRTGAPGDPGSVPRVNIPTPRRSKAGAQAMTQFGEDVQRFAVTMAQRQAEQESRRVQVEAMRINAEYAAEMNEAVNTGADFEPIAEKYLGQMDEVSADLSSRGGQEQYDFQRAKMEIGFQDSQIKAHGARAKREAKVQLNQMSEISGIRIAADPTSLPAVIEENNMIIDTFSNMPAEDRDFPKEQNARDLTWAAGNTLLQNDPIALKEALLDEEALPDLSPSQRVQLMGRADAEIERARKQGEAKDDMAKMLLLDALESESKDHVLKNEEAQDWFDQGITPAQWRAARKNSERYAAAQAQLAADISSIQTGSGAVLSQDRYENALTQLTKDATKGLPAEQAASLAVEIRSVAAISNGREDQKVKALLNAGPAGGDATFSAGLALRARFKQDSPELYNKMVDAKSRMWYNSYDFMTGQLGLSHEAARTRLLEFSDNRKEAEARMASKENRELVEDAVDIEFPGQIPVAHKQITDVATAYLALNPMMTAEQAVAKAADDFEQSTEEINQGIRANVRGVPVQWEDADEYVRDTILRKDFEDAGFPFEDPDDYTIIPNGDGTAAIAAPNGLIIFPNWDWQGATSEWFVNRAQIEAEQKQKEAVRIEKAQRVTGGLAGAAALGGI